MESLKTQIDLKKLPKHIAVIMDGNGRWAKMRGKPRVFGHRNGVNAVREISESAAELGVEWLTLYAFSTENWNRPALEVNALMSLLVETIRKEIATLNKNNIRLNAIGDLEKLPSRSYKALIEGIEGTAQNTRMTLTLALNYSSRWELTKATQQIAEACRDGVITPDAISEDLISQYLETAQIPNPELMIRTSGERRISNYLLWQLAYAELYFTDVFWPDFKNEHLYAAIVDFQHRERRFGMTGEQLQDFTKQTTE
jgi:undecaprenyl diphosphate synthase